MAYFNKVGLVILNSDGTKFLVCEKGSFTTDYLTPGGKIEKDECDEECLAREIKEELNVEINKDSLKYINTYLGLASGDNTKDVSIKLYKGEIIDEPTPSQEIIKLHWIGKEDTTNIRVSPIIRYKIIPDLIKKEILK